MHLRTDSVGAPEAIEALLGRARALTGRALRDLADACGASVAGAHVAAKGKPGALLELLLGATGGPAAVHDFPDLGVELKTLPIDQRGTPLESTYVCVVPADDAGNVDWETSWARAKLSCVLFVPIRATHRQQAFGDRVVGHPFLWRPTAEQDAALKADFEEIVGAIALGGVENLTAHVGKILQCRPKAANGSVRMHLTGPEGEAIATVPRGFYLRPSFTASLLASFS